MNEHCALSERELYEFDLTGYVILRDFLAPKLVLKMNQLIDQHQQQKKDKPCKFPFLHIDPTFLDLMTHPKVMSICAFTLGESFRLDHVYGLQAPPVSSGTPSGEGENLHAGPYANQGSFRYHWYNGRPQCGLLVFAYAMEKVNSGDGGLVMVPGSHKQNLPYKGKDIFRMLSETKEASWIHNPSLNPGDLLIFTEAVVHGTMRWTRKDQKRRNLYYKYSPGFQAWRGHEQVEKYGVLARNDIESKLFRAPFVGNYEEDDFFMQNNQWRDETIKQH
jgi:hypothetical protein